MGILDRRFYPYNYGCDDGYDGYGGYCNSAWERWGRWVLLGVIILFAIFLFFLFSCLTARRRRRMGYAPYRGTGWAAFGGNRYNNSHNMAPPPEQYTTGGNYQQPYYGQTQQSTYNSPPAYGTNEYYGRGGANDVELQQPQQVYGGYSAPAGPPPGKR